MSRDQEIYAQIGNLIYTAAPEGASKIVMKASRIAPEGDAARFQYNSYFPDGKTEGFTAGGKINNKILSLLVELRHLLEFHGGSFWGACEFSLNTTDGSFSIDFNYDESED